jgi:hypothetical protein
MDIDNTRLDSDNFIHHWLVQGDPSPANHKGVSTYRIQGTNAYINAYIISPKKK